jgi:hypothetical protein
LSPFVSVAQPHSCQGIPAIRNAGNVLRAQTSLLLSFRLPPTLKPDVAKVKHTDIRLGHLDTRQIETNRDKSTQTTRHGHFHFEFPRHRRRPSSTWQSTVHWRSRRRKLLPVRAVGRFWRVGLLAVCCRLDGHRTPPRHTTTAPLVSFVACWFVGCLLRLDAPAHHHATPPPPLVSLYVRCLLQAGMPPSATAG